MVTIVTGAVEAVEDVVATGIVTATDDVTRARRVRAVLLASSSQSSEVASDVVVDGAVMLPLLKKLRSACRIDMVQISLH